MNLFRKLHTDPTTSLDPLDALCIATPQDVLSTDARDALYVLRHAGVDVDAYTVAGDRWVIWVRPAHGWQEGRFSPAEWEAFYRQWLALRHGAGQLDAAYWQFVCEMLAERQPNGQLVTAAAPAPATAEGGAA